MADVVTISLSELAAAAGVDTDTMLQRLAAVLSKRPGDVSEQIVPPGPSDTQETTDAPA